MTKKNEDVVKSACGGQGNGSRRLGTREPGAVHDPVNSPIHYRSSPSGIECIEVVEHMNFCRGNATKYIWRAGQKGDELEDLKKARWYLDREIARVEKEGPSGNIEKTIEALQEEETSREEADREVEKVIQSLQGDTGDIGEQISLALDAIESTVHVLREEVNSREEMTHGTRANVLLRLSEALEELWPYRLMEKSK